MMTEEQSRPGPHQGQPILVAGEPLQEDPLEHARVAIILLHGRGATAASMLELASEILLLLSQPQLAGEGAL